MKINKHRRLGKIIQTLERWAPMEVSEISQSLAYSFGVEENEIKRNVSNDLKFLRDEGELTPLYFNKFGEMISTEIEPQDESYYRIKWQLRSQQGEYISGAQETKRFSTFIMANDEIKQDLRVRQGLGKSPEEWSYFYFELNNEIYHLQIPKQPRTSSIEPTLVIGLCRSQNDDTDNLKRDFNFFSINYPNIPRILISFKEPFLSSMESEAPITLEFLGNGLINIISEKNKNKLQYLEVPEGKAKNLLSYLTLFRDKTQTTHWTDLKKEQGFAYQEGNGFNLCSPLLLRLKESTGYLIQ